MCMTFMPGAIERCVFVGLMFGFFIVLFCPKERQLLVPIKCFRIKITSLLTTTRCVAL